MLCYSIKNGDISFFKYAIKEICIIFQALIALKPKYARAILRQVYIFNTKVTNSIFQEKYLANTFINPRGKF